VTETDKADLAGLYRDTREQLSDLIAELGAAALRTMVPACPLWAVRDVLAHLTAITEDVLAGRLAGLPDEEFTADQVARFAHVPVPEMLARWSASGPQFENVVQMFRWRMGRRSLAQLAAMDWSGDPAAILGKLTVFGPAASDIVE
jgi:hypothetical protein